MELFSEDIERGKSKLLKTNSFWFHSFLPYRLASMWRAFWVLYFFMLLFCKRFGFYKRRWGSNFWCICYVYIVIGGNMEWLLRSWFLALFSYGEARSKVLSLTRNDAFLSCISETSSVLTARKFTICQRSATFAVSKRATMVSISAAYTTLSRLSSATRLQLKS